MTVEPQAMADSRAHLRIENPSLHGNKAKVWLNGEDITHQVERIEVAWDCRDANRATLTVLVDELVVDGKVLVYRADAPQRFSDDDGKGRDG